MTINERMRIRDLALAVNKNLSCSFVEASSILILHEVSWSGEFETHAVDDAIILFVQWASFLISGTSESSYAQFGESWHNLFVTALELRQQFWSTTTDRNLSLWNCLLDVACSLYSC